MRAGKRGKGSPAELPSIHKFSSPAQPIFSGSSARNRGGPSADWEGSSVPAPVGTRSSANYASAKPRYRAVTDVEQTTNLRHRLACPAHREGFGDLKSGELRLPPKPNPSRLRSQFRVRVRFAS
jgi:hypothetical protein